MLVLVHVVFWFQIQIHNLDTFFGVISVETTDHILGTADIGIDF